jgi:small nuclear ribonucleoprotein (snRNP)-like protein
MNIALENAQEWTSGAVSASFGDVFIRGNNGMMIF